MDIGNIERQLNSVISDCFSGGGDPNEIEIKTISRVAKLLEYMGLSVDEDTKEFIKEMEDIGHKFNFLEEEIIEYCSNGNIAKIKELLPNAGDINYGWALRVAISNNNIDIVEYLLDNGATLEDVDGSTLNRIQYHGLNNVRKILESKGMKFS